MRWDTVLPREVPRPLSMHGPPPPDLPNRRDNFRPRPSFLCVFGSMIYHVTQSKQGISSTNRRRLGVTQTTAWKITQIEAGHAGARRQQTIDRTCRADDAHLGGERTGGKRGRGAPGKTPFVAAVETTPEGKPVRLKMRRVTSFCGHDLDLAKRSLDPNCAVVSDGLQCFGHGRTPGVRTRSSATGSGPRSVRGPPSGGLNTALGNIKSAIVGNLLPISSKHVPRYLAGVRVPLQPTT